MASVEAKDIPEIKNFMGDFWNLVKTYWKPEDSDSYWQSAYNTMTVLGNQEKYKKFTFCRLCILAFMDYLELTQNGNRKELYLHRAEYLRIRGATAEEDFWRSKADYEKEQEELRQKMKG